ncbi:DUF427 domain-containing protein [Sneathiella sp.]|uniref:DUF427 domain-containing protein n=1 Tax=Sneathiella sp. TaxID=1964365 RepID=UPI0035618049
MEANHATENAPGFAKYPDYKIDIDTPTAEITAMLQGKVIASSKNVLIVRESNHVPVVYFPPGDVRLDLATRTDKESFCPFKGDATYWTFGDEKNIAWSYEDPFLEMQKIKGYLAFYTDRLDAPLI